jgi:hypothetical protein
MVQPAGFEPATYGLGIRRSILLSYGCIEPIIRNASDFVNLSLQQSNLKKMIPDPPRTC